jgi:hypothetical protein
MEMLKRNQVEAGRPDERELKKQLDSRDRSTSELAIYGRREYRSEAMINKLRDARCR